MFSVVGEGDSVTCAKRRMATITEDIPTSGDER